MLESGECLRVHGQPGTGPDLRQEAPGDLPGGEPGLPSPQHPPAALARGEAPGAARPTLGHVLCSGLLPGLLLHPSQPPFKGLVAACSREWGQWEQGPCFPSLECPSVSHGAGPAGATGSLCSSDTAPAEPVST